MDRTDTRTRDTKTGAFSILLTATIVLYPVLVYFGIRSGRFEWFAVALIAIFSARLLILALQGRGKRVSVDLQLVAVAGIGLGVLSIASGSADAMLYYPFAVNCVLLHFFSLSLIKPPSAIERIARRVDRNFPESAVAYTRKVTIAWVVFFVLNGTVSLFTIWVMPLEIWTLYNGFVSYLLIGCMFLGEFAVRRWVRRKAER
jgi:uncharacterized membrane protein